MKILNVGYDKIIRTVFLFLFFGLLVPFNNYYLNLSVVSLISFVLLYEWKFIIKEKLYNYDKKLYFILGFLFLIVPYGISLFFLKTTPGILLMLFVISMISNFLLFYLNQVSGHNLLCADSFKKNSVEGVIGSIIFTSIIIYYINGQFHFMSLSEEKGYLFVLFLTIFSVFFRVIAQVFKKKIGLKEIVGSDLFKSRIALEYFLNTNILIVVFIPLYLAFKY